MSNIHVVRHEDKTVDRFSGTSGTGRKMDEVCHKLVTFVHTHLGDASYTITDAEHDYRADPIQAVYWADKV